MTQRESKPTGVQWMLPYITVKDARNAVEFYEKAFGFLRGELIPDDDGKIIHAEMNWQGEVLMLGPECSQNTAKAPVTTGVQSAMSLYIYCDDVDAMYQQALQAGAKSFMEPQDMFWGDRMCDVIDPDGHHWVFATHIA